jgi:hypothetical protein
MTYPPARVRYTTLQRSVALAVTLHNFEEWLTFPRYGDIGADFLRRLGIAVSTPPWSATQIALALATILPGGIALYGATRDGSRLWTWLVLFVQLQLGVNVLLPHLPAAFFLRGYAPGLLTALAINLPLSIILARRTVSEGRLTRRATWLCLLAAFIAMPLAIVGLVTMGSVIASSAR